MYYYLVAVGSNKYHGDEPLTYASPAQLMLGAIVQISVRKELLLGFVVSKTTRPSFAVKEITVVAPQLPVLPKHLVSLFGWMRTYYPAPLGSTAQLFLPKGLPNKRASSIVDTLAAPSAVTQTSSLPPLNHAQSVAVATIKRSGTHVLFGNTGSGKTRVYIELALRAFAHNRSAIILTPEISLTSQLLAQFITVFGAQHVVVLHSHMTHAKRRDTWYQIATTNTPLVVIGARSALFAPLWALGLIVLDEFHDGAYKQENAPHYHAARVAAKLADYCNAPAILGSATPSVTDYYIAQDRHRPIIRLTGNATGKQTTVRQTIVDMRDRTKATRTPYLSDELLEAIDQQLKRASQTLIFLNRRGTARIVLCAQCGWQALCPHCDLSLTYHHDSHRLRCHACNYSERAHTSCPACDNPDITLKSIGTKTIAATLADLFPTARIVRFDADNKTGEHLHEQYAAIRDGKVDVIIGTQLLAKGLDLPHLGLIGIVNADASLYIPDFSAQERTYQLLHQVLGRVGRGHGAGTTIIQTYSPDNETIQCAINKSWEKFYTNELVERRAYNFPPFCHMLKVTSTRRTAARSELYLAKVKNNLETNVPRLIVDGPAPAFHEKAGDRYVWQLIIKAKHRQLLLNAIALLPKDCSFDIDPVDLL